MAKIKQLSQYWLWGIIIIGVGGLSAALGMGTVVAWQVFLGDDTALRKTTILAKIKEETTLYYLDEKTRIGSFFESNHRRYISIDEVPPHVNNAIIAAEDKNFYRHFGIDPVALIKAIGEGVLSGGRFRRGGSTITQQTVKNIMDDWEASFSRKFREMIKAIQLERLYTKRQVLEFYLNQFHVAGNGNGIGIAAKYYFNKDVQDLTLVEGAFIAGSVKGPGKYNPFIKYTKKTRERAKAFANERKNYVLDRMLELGWIAKEEHDDAIKTDVPFNQGEFRSAEVSLVDLVRSQLKKKEVLEALNIKSIRDLNVAGMRVYTTIDLDMQKAAQLAMRRNLSRLDTILKGFTSEDKEEFKPLRKLKLNEFYYGKVEAIEGTKPENMSIKLSFGFPKGVIPTESLIRYAKLLDLPIGNPRGWKHYMEEMKKTIKVGDVLYVEVMDYDSETNDAVLEFRKRPDISGGLIAIDKGEVRAVVSGFDTLGFNRAMHAKRPPGSVFKSVVYFAAMQLGWTVLDQVNNSRQIFPFQGQFYYPRPDHASPYRKASILWSGTMSENLSSVALTSRLVEKLNFEQFKELMGFMGYLPKLGESSRDFHYRVSKATGVSIDNKGIEEFQLKNAVNDIAPDLVFSGTQKLLNYLERMWLGEGYIAELKNLNGFDRKKFSLREYRIRRNLVKNNFRRYKRLADDLSSNWKALEVFFEENEAETAFTNPEIQKILEKFRVLPSAGNRPELGYFLQFSGEELPNSFTTEELLSIQNFSGRPLNVLDVQAIWGRSGFFSSAKSANVAVTDVKLAGKIPFGTFTRIEQYKDSRYEGVLNSSDEYDLLRYFQHHDFRVILGLNYLVKLSKEMGVYSHLEPVLSFPLGTNDITAGEVAKIYQTFISGKTYKFFEKGPSNQLTFIRRIEDRTGNVLYEINNRPHQVVKPVYAEEMREVLRKVITHGTGKRARGELYISLDGEDGKVPKAQASHKGEKIRVPVFGKTGTTNDFTTSYFAGLVPYPVVKSSRIDPENSYVLASYVGYDDNKMMRRGRMRIAGSSGALPLWSDLAKEIIEIKKYRDYLDQLDLKVISNKQWPLKFSQQAKPLMVDLPRGLVIRGGGQSDYDLWDATDIAHTGETYENPFALGSSVKSIVYLNQDVSGGSWQPYREFSMFSERSEAEALALGDSKKTHNQVNSRIEQDPQALDSSERLYDNMGNRVSSSVPADSIKNDSQPVNKVTPKSEVKDPELGKIPEQPPVDTEFDGETLDSDDSGYVEDDLW